MHRRAFKHTWFWKSQGGLSFSIIVIPRADCIHLIVMRCINKVIIRLAVPCLSNYYNFVSSKFTRKNTIYYLQVACVICPEIRREIFSIVKLYIQFCWKSSFFTERNTQPYYLIHNEKWKFIVPLATPHWDITSVKPIKDYSDWSVLSDTARYQVSLVELLFFGHVFTSYFRPNIWNIHQRVDWSSAQLAKERSRIITSEILKTRDNLYRKGKSIKDILIRAKLWRQKI